MERNNLENLQWLQQNARVYLTGMAVVTFFLALSFCFFLFEPWQPQSPGAAFLTGKDSDEAVAEQQIPEPQRETTAGNGQNGTDIKQTEAPSQVDAESSAKAEEEQKTETEVKAEPEIITIDPTQFVGYTAPCNGRLVYGYGLGYDPVYEDYRFHDQLCYQASTPTVLAAQAGVVKQVDLAQKEQVIVQCETYTLIYSGMRSCEVVAGQALEAGQVIGTMEEYLYLQARE